LKYIDENVNREEGSFDRLLDRLGDKALAGLVGWLGSKEAGMEEDEREEASREWHTGYYSSWVDYEKGESDRALQRLRALRAKISHFDWSWELFQIDRMIAQILKIRRGWLGIETEPLDQEWAAQLRIPSPIGLLVEKVSPHGPAEQAGVDVGDIIIAINDAPVPEGWVPSLIGAGLAGDEVRLSIWRGGGAIELVAKLGEAPGAESFSWMDAKLADITGELMAAYVDQALFAQVEKVGGVLLTTPTPDARRDYDVGTDTDGALVVRVAEWAQGVGIQPGDMISEVDGEPVKGPAMLAKTVSEICLAGRTTLNLRIWRKGEHIAVPAGLCSE
jgi:hypothetical protein